MGDDTNAIAKGATNHLRRGNFYDKRSLMPRFPPYSQQCTDDAGPPFQDDDVTYGSGGKYHDGKPAMPIGDSCPDPLKEACRTKSKKAAFLEGPVDCGDKGWFCRIEEETGWPANNLISDLNFGYCNTQEGFEDAGFDRAGHCHGSDADETFYWWVRDHWFRGYNGKMRCCCGWDTIVKTGSIVNRCDHRRLVKPTENLDQCRDANEDGATPYNEGCAANGPFTIGQPINEEGSQCWEVSKFGEPADVEDNVVENNEGGGDDEQEDDEGGDDNEEDEGIEENENQDDNENNQGEENEGGNDEDDENSENENENEDQDEDDIGGNENDDQDDNEIQNQDNEDNQNDEEENNSGNDEETEDNEVENNPGNEEEIENNESVNEENIFDENDIQEEDKCVDVEGKFVFKKKKKKKCSWAAKKLKKFKKKNKEKKIKKFCTKKKTSEGVTIGTHCPVTCGLC